MPVRSAAAIWNGNFKNGSGSMKLGSGAFTGNYSAASRFEEGPGTNPEELIAAAHAGCFSMALSLALQKQDYEAEHIHTVARVRIEKIGPDYKITSIELETECRVPGIEDGIFLQIAESAKKNCPVSQALSSVPVRFTARLTKALAA
jgi:osmotically inducible protein OsmC